MIQIQQKGGQFFAVSENRRYYTFGITNFAVGAPTNPSPSAQYTFANFSPKFEVRLVRIKAWAYVLGSTGQFNRWTDVVWNFFAPVTGSNVLQPLTGEWTPLLNAQSFNQLQFYTNPNQINFDQEFSGIQLSASAIYSLAFGHINTVLALNESLVGYMYVTFSKEL